MSLGKDRLKQLRNALGFSQPIFSQYLGINNSTINHIENGNQRLSVKVALVLREKIVQKPDGRLRILTDENPKKDDEAQLRMDWLVTGQGEPFDKTISNLNSIEIFINEKRIIFPKGENIEFYCMPDETMSPNFTKNDYIAIDTNQKEIKNGGIYLISVFGDSFVRQIFKIGKDKLNVVASNKELVPAIEACNEEISIIGRCVYRMTLLQ